MFIKSLKKYNVLSLTETNKNDFESLGPWRKDSHHICPSGRFHALRMLPSDERVIRSERLI
jgi:hypothetical protein